MRLEGRQGNVVASLGDAAPIAVGPLASLSHLRGLVLDATGGSRGMGPRLQAFGGVPTPVSALPRPRLALAGLAAGEVPFDVAKFSFAVVGFGRGATLGAPGAAGPDSLAGRGASGTVGWRVPLGSGSLSGIVVGQLHTLDGRRAIAAAHRHELLLVSRRVALSLHDERASPRARRLGTDRLVPAPRSEDRWNLQTRLFDGRAEAHVAGAWRAGGEVALVSRTVQLGGSGSWGASPWYGGLEAAWYWREAGASRDQRLTLHAGVVSERGRAFVGRIERATRVDGPEVLGVGGETSWPLGGGVRLAMIPRLAWSAGRWEHAGAGVRLACPLGLAATRLTGSLTMGASRDDGFRYRVREAAVALSWSPRGRDRGDLEVRRQSETGTPVLEYSAAYDARFQRYEPAAGWRAARDTAAVEVRVVRAGDRSPVADALVSLDGKDLRFTDSEGRARFAPVTPGVHVVAIEERSLPRHTRAVSETRVFITVERDVAAPPVQFEVARPERQTRF
jgi:hypothetical protein